MSKKILFLGALFAATSMSAQSLEFGLKGGLNFSNESGNTVVKNYIGSDDHKMKTGFHVGAVANYRINPKFALEADLLYSMQGYKDKMTVEAEQIINNENFTVTSHYLTLPIAAKFYPVDNFYVECGPQVGYLLSKKGKLDNWDNDNPFTSDVNKKFDFGILGGLGYEFDNGFLVEARYVHGLTGTMKDIDGHKNRNVQISVGYLF